MKDEYIFHFRPIDRSKPVPAGKYPPYSNMGGITVVIQKDETQKEPVDGMWTYCLGYSVCSPHDNFNRRIGLAIARGWKKREVRQNVSNGLFLSVDSTIQDIRIAALQNACWVLNELMPKRMGWTGSELADFCCELDMLQNALRCEQERSK